MISINLLPQEYRQKRRTPLKLMLAVAASVAINGGLVAYWSWTAFGVAAEVESELALLQDEDSSLKPQVEYHRSLETESKTFQSREQMLQRITSLRVSWTQKVDQLLDVINGVGSSNEYLVWLDDLSVDMKENKRRGTYGTVKSSGFSGSEDFSNVANFFDDIVASRLMDDFGQPAPPQGTVSSEDTELIPSKFFSFPLEMALKDPKERLSTQQGDGGESR